MSKVVEKYGIVALLDALGIQNATSSESIHFVNHLSEHAEGILDFMDGYTSGADEVKKHFQETKPITRTFGDTFLITWEVPNEGNIEEYIEAICAAVAQIIYEGISQGILFRGAISIGSYLESDTTIIGPAITDAAAWHEQANWFGCITTPNCSQHINYLYHDKNFVPHLVKYNVPFKSKDSFELWCVDWPDQVECFEDTTPLLWYYQNISKLQIPIGTENKYINSEKFFKHSFESKT